MAYFPKSMIKKILPGGSLAFDLSSIIDKLLDLLFGAGSEGGSNSATPGSTTGVPGATISTSDLTIFETRNLDVYAMRTEDFEKGDFDKAVFVSNKIPIDADAEPVIVRFRPRPLLADYQKGTIDRYVLYDIRNEGIIEVSQDDYVQFRTLRYKRSTVISWYIFGNADDYQIGKYIYPGVRNNNIDVLAQAENIVPGISDYFEDKIEYLLSDLADYSGDPEVINLPDPPDPTDDQDEEDIEDLGFGDDTINLPPPPPVDLDFADDIAGDMSAADEILGNLSSSIDDLVAEQDEITAEQEALLAEQEDRLRNLEEDQEKQLRENEIQQLLIDMDPAAYGKLAMDIINMSSKARRKKKRRRLDQGRDEKKIPKIVSGLLHKTKHKNEEGVPWEFTVEEVIAGVNKSGLKQRLKLRKAGSKIECQWTRNQKEYYKTTTVYTIPAATTTSGKAESSSSSIPNPDIPWSTTTLSAREKTGAVNILNGRERRQANKRKLITDIWKEQKYILEQKAPGSTSNFNNTRKKAQDRFNQWKTRTDGGTTYNSSNRRRGQRGSSNNSSGGRNRGRSSGNTGGGRRRGN